MNWPFFHLSLLAVLLYFHPLKSDDHFIRKKQRQIFVTHQEMVLTQFEKVSLGGLANALCLGNKSKVKKAHRQALAHLGLLHLLTPSGLHFSSIFIFILPILNLIKKKRRRLYWLIEISIIAGLYIFTSLHSAKRISLLRHFLKFGVKKTIPLYPLFLLMMFTDFMLGSYSRSPLSFIYSGAFLGALISCEKRPKIVLLAAIIAVQIMVAASGQTYIYLLGSIIGLAITSFFSLFFPVIFVMYWIPPLYPILEGILVYAMNGIELFNFVAISTGGLIPPIWTIVILPLFAARKWTKKKLTIACCIILFYSSPIYNLPVTRVKKTFGGKISIEKITAIKRTAKGYQWRDRYHRKCQVGLFIDGYRELCD